jgi:hypothetical protein
MKLNTFARFGFVAHAVTETANSRQVLIVDSVEMDRVALGVAGFGAWLESNRR